MKWPGKIPQNLPYFWNTKTPCSFFVHQISYRHVWITWPHFRLNLNPCVSYLWFTFYYTTFEITPRHLLWQFDTHLLYIFILVIIFVRGCFYTIHDALEIGEILNICLKKCQKLHFPTNFRKLWWSWERIHFIQFTKEEWK